MKTRTRIYKFGPFHYDMAQQELRRRDQRLPLPASLFKLLALFISRRGELITRDQIEAALWEDTSTIDVDLGVYSAIRRLRAQLGDDKASPIYIETVVGTGYRFIAKVEEIDPEEAAGEAPEKTSERNGRPPASGASQTAVAVSIASPVTVTVEEGHEAPKGASQPANGPEQKATKTVPQTILALLRSRWRLAAALGIYVLLVAGAIVAVERRGASSLLGPLAAPVFSPPHVQIGFINGVDKITQAVISPDGRLLAYSNRAGVTIHETDSGAEHMLPSPASFVAERLAWYPDEHALLLSGVDSTRGLSQVWVVTLNGEPPHLLLDDASLAAVSPDGRRIAYSRKQESEIWVADADGSNARPLVQGKDGDRVSFLLWTPEKNRLIFDWHNSVFAPTEAGSTADGSVSPAISQDQWTYKCIDAGTGKLLAEEESIRFDSAFQLSDGRLFYAANGLMMVKTDPETGRFLSHPQLLIPSEAWDVSRHDIRIGSLSASANGSQVGAVLERKTPDVYIGQLSLPGPTLTDVTRLTDSSLSNYPHAWTPQGDAVIFENKNYGPSTISKQRVDGSKMLLLAQLPKNAALAEFTPDGQWMLFMEFTDWPSHAMGIYSLPASGGAPRQLKTTGVIDEFSCPVSSKGTCVLRETVEKQEFDFYALDPVAGMGQKLGRMDWEPSTLGDWSISPDGSTVAMANHDPMHPSIRLVPLSMQTPTRMTDIPVRGFGTILEPTWSPDGKGFFVESKIDTCYDSFNYDFLNACYDLLYVDLAGHARLLRESSIPIWGIPSRDGKKLAFPDATIYGDVWVSHTSLQ
jgi:DNA-binding winged helix-turn-helix (wHTH) protein/Tol biopolymer transport system component